MNKLKTYFNNSYILNELGRVDILLVSLLLSGFISLVLGGGFIYTNMVKQENKRLELEKEIQLLKIDSQKTNTSSQNITTNSAPPVQVPTQNAPVAIPEVKERKRVSFTTKQAIVDGTYYCYEDRVNELTNMEKQITLKEMSADSCKDNANLKADSCTKNCPLDDSMSKCVDKCWDKSYDECEDKYKAVGDLRKKYSSLINEICP